MAHSHKIYIYMHMYVRQKPHLPRTQETKSPELYVAFDPLLGWTEPTGHRVDN